MFDMKEFRELLSSMISILGFISSASSLSGLIVSRGSSQQTFSELSSFVMIYEAALSTLISGDMGWNSEREKAASQTGSMTVNVIPPVGFFIVRITPLCSFTRCDTKFSPIPKPSVFLGPSIPSSRLNGWKILGMSSSCIPSPLSTTDI